LAVIKNGRRKLAPNASITDERHARPSPVKRVSAAHRSRRGSGTSCSRPTVAVDLAPQRINAVCPGLTLTELMTKRRVPGRIEAATAGLPLPRAASHAEVATAYVYIMPHGYLTGQILLVDGGDLLV
jgi:hypothetical protein